MNNLLLLFFAPMFQIYFSLSFQNCCFSALPISIHYLFVGLEYSFGVGLEAALDKLLFSVDI